MKNPIAYVLDALSPGGALHDAARRGEAKLLAWLLSQGIYKVDCYYNDRTALYVATLAEQHACILALLQNKADPNLTSLNAYLKVQEKPIQNSIYGSNTSDIKLLVMQGANDDEISFIKNRQDIKNLFYEIMKLKQQCEDYLKEAETQLLNKQYPQALINYKQAGDIWYNLTSKESVPLYINFYQEQALLFYKKAISCYDKLSTVEFSDELKVVCQSLFERAADCCQLLKLADEAKIYSSKSANHEYSLTSFDAKTFLKTLSTASGIYQMLNTERKVLYVGKAKNLKKRVSNYFKKNSMLILKLPHWLDFYFRENFTNISGKIFYIVAGEAAGTKLVTAQKTAMPLLNEAEFIYW